MISWVKEVSVHGQRLVVISSHEVMGHRAGVRWVFIPASHRVTRVISKNRTSPAWAALCFPALWHTQSHAFEPSPVATWMFPSDSNNGDWCSFWFPGALKQIIRGHRTCCKVEASCFTRYRGSKRQSSSNIIVTVLFPGRRKCHGSAGNDKQCWHRQRQQG